MKANLKKALLTKVAALGIAMLVLGSGTTWAADMCFRETTGGTLVGKNFSFPGPGTCKAFDGFGVGGGCVITGTACGTSNNVDIRFNLNASCNHPGFFGEVSTHSFRIDRLVPGIDGSGFGYWCKLTGFTNATWTCNQFHVKTIPCSSPVPVD